MSITKNILYKFVLSTVMLIGACSNASALELVVSNNGKLVGASNVNVAGSLYDVHFARDRCNTLFDRCTSFTFTSLADATSASQALSTSVLLDFSPAQKFDTVPNSVTGCLSPALCKIITPYSTSANGTFSSTLVNGSVFKNSVLESSDGISSGALLRSNTFPDSNMSYAVWSVHVSTDPLYAAYGTTYHVRPDGGNSTQCNGLANAAYPGTGTGLACAWGHPFVAIPPIGSYNAIRISGGDTLIIHYGNYALGIDSTSQAYSDGCNSSYSYDCYMKPIPSGADVSHPTRIVGEGYTSGCPSNLKPTLWGASAAYMMINMQNANNITLACIEITDHGNCYNHPGAASCVSGGNWANDGISITNASNIVFRDLDIHGLAGGGISSNVINNFTMTNVRLAANAFDGYSANGSNTGTMKFTGLMVEWNGCIETYPDKTITNCHSWYGDGLGAAATAGDWIIEDATFRYNVSDGLDLLYHNLGGNIKLNRVKAEGNAGNQVKVNGNVVITNSIVVGNCNFFYGKSFTEDVTNCRALGDAMAVSVAHAGESVYLINNTIISEGNTVVYAGAGSQVAGTLYATNNILIGHPFVVGPVSGADQQSADIYPEPDGNYWTFIETYNIKESVRGGGTSCGVNGNLCGSAGLVNQTPGSIDANLITSSPARNSGISTGLNIPTTDFFNRTRTATQIDRGAVEMQ